MPPYVPRKRLRDNSPSNAKPPKKGKTAAAAAAVVAPRRKRTLFDDLDATASPKAKGKAAQLLGDSSDDDESSLTSLSDAGFEDVPPPAKPADEDDEDEDMEFEDVSYQSLAPQTLAPPSAGGSSGDLALTLSHIPTVSYIDGNGKKTGPSKNEKRIRVATHCMHVQFLMWHNSIRNSWLCDPEVQGIMLSHLPPKMWEEVERWRRSSGLEVTEEEMPKKAPKGDKNTKGRGRPKGKAAGKPARDWGDAAQRLEKGAVDLSHGDPLFRLLKALSSWWKQRFTTTAPGIRKIGYMQTRRCANFIRGYQKGFGDPNRYGERIPSLEEFRIRAQECSGSRDVGAQLFTALLRAIGLEARMVANLQAVGYGWTKLDEANPEKEDGKANGTDQDALGNREESEGTDSKKKPAKSKAKNSKQASQSGRPTRNRKSLREESDDSDLAIKESDDESVAEIPPLTPKKGAKNKSFDRDLEFPHYWTEVLSPVTNKYIPVDVVVKAVVGSNREFIESLEPRGKKADEAKQIMAYVVGFSQDGTAKEVTVRYLKKQLFPGRTKGMRLPVEKVPVHNKNGRVKRYDQFDWFRSILRGYSRGGQKHPITDIDEEEDSTDLTPAQPQKKEVKEGEETLQYYKQSKEFVLERHLKREEALFPGAEPVKVFKNKGKKGETEEEPVYRRKDVVLTKSQETWHKQGRAPKPGEQPLKRVPYRAATTNRRREIAELEAESGQKALQGLYSLDQTDWIIPPPIVDGVIPKNNYGNIDLFAEHMCPEGAVHVPFRGAVRVCKRLQIDYAEAVVDFEFGHRMAVPVIQGVVIAEEYHDQVMEGLAKDEAEKARKEDEKRKKAALAAWRKLLMGMRIVERVRREYGDIKDDFVPFGHSRDANHKVPVEDNAHDDEDMGGGFLPEGYKDDEEEGQGGGFHTSGFFPVVDEDEEDDAEGAGLVIEDSRVVEAAEKAYATPQSGEVAKATPKPKSKPTRSKKAETRPRRRTRQTVVSSSEDDDEDEYMESD